MSEENSKPSTQSPEWMSLKKSEYDQLLSENQALKAECDHHIEKAAHFEMELFSAKKEVERLQAGLKISEDYVLNSCYPELRKLKTENKALKKENAQLKATRVGSIQEHQEIIQDLSAQLLRMREALEKIKCQNGFYPSCQEVQKERNKHKPSVDYGADIIPCARCEALASLPNVEIQKDLER